MFFACFSLRELHELMATCIGFPDCGCVLCLTLKESVIPPGANSVSNSPSGGGTPKSSASPTSDVTPSPVGNTKRAKDQASSAEQELSVKRACHTCSRLVVEIPARNMQNESADGAKAQTAEAVGNEQKDDKTTVTQASGAAERSDQQQVVRTGGSESPGRGLSVAAGMAGGASARTSTTPSTEPSGSSVRFDCNIARCKPVAQLSGPGSCKACKGDVIDYLNDPSRHMVRTMRATVHDHGQISDNFKNRRCMQCIQRTPNKCPDICSCGCHLPPAQAALRKAAQKAAANSPCLPCALVPSCVMVGEVVGRTTAPEAKVGGIVAPPPATLLPAMGPPPTLITTTCVPALVNPATAAPPPRAGGVLKNDPASKEGLTGTTTKSKSGAMPFPAKNGPAPSASVAWGSGGLEKRASAASVAVQLGAVPKTPSSETTEGKSASKAISPKTPPMTGSTGSSGHRGTGGIPLLVELGHPVLTQMEMYNRDNRMMGMVKVHDVVMVATRDVLCVRAARVKMSGPSGRFLVTWLHSGEEFWTRVEDIWFPETRALLPPSQRPVELHASVYG